MAKKPASARSGGGGGVVSGGIEVAHGGGGISKNQRVQNLSAKAVNFVEEGKEKKAQAALKKAKQVAQTIKNPSNKANAALKTAKYAVHHPKKWNAKNNPSPSPIEEPPPPVDDPTGNSDGNGTTDDGSNVVTPPAPAPIPVLPQYKPLSSTNFAVKQAPKDTIVFNDESIGIAILSDLMYEDVGGIELANISRTDLVDGQDVVYSPIANLSSLKRRFNPNNIISASSSSETYFSRFAIDLIQRGIYFPYFDDDGNLIIEIDDVKDDEIIEVEIASNGTINRVDI